MTDTTQPGEPVLDWLRTEEALRQARRLASNWRLGGHDGLAENIAADALMAVWERLQKDPPLVVENPAAYGTQVLKSVVRAAAQGQRAVASREPGIDPPDEPQVTVDPGRGLLGIETRLDDFRLAIEGAPVPHPWVTSSMLSYFTLALDGEFTPEMAPRPQAGARPDQARCWPARWFAGQRQVFDEGADARERNRIRRARARRIQTVLDAYAAVGHQLAAEEGLTHG